MRRGPEVDSWSLVGEGERAARMPTPCRAFRSGHCTHPSAPLPAHTGTPRTPSATWKLSEDGWITFTDVERQRHRWWHHDTERMIPAARTGSPFVRIGNSMFLTAPQPIRSDGPGLVRLRRCTHRLPTQLTTAALTGGQPRPSLPGVPRMSRRAGSAARGRPLRPMPEVDTSTRPPYAAGRGQPA